MAHGGSMFMIYRYLATASAIVLVFALVLAAQLYRQQAVRDLIEISEGYNTGLAKALSDSVWSRHREYLDMVGDLAPEELAGRPETERIHETLRDLTEELSVLKVKIYRADGTTIYSTEAAQIGESHRDSPALLAAQRDNTPSSELAFKDRFSAFSGEVFNRDVVETYVPLKAHDGNTVAVFEIYTDVTTLVDRIERTTLTILFGLIAIFAALYAVLVFGVMRRAIEPVYRASRSAAAIGPRSAGARLPTEGMPKELLPLIEAMNGALERLDNALDAQRQFSADAAHELLTPLAVLRANLETLEDKAAVASLREDVIAMSDVTNQLLELAELEAAAPVESRPVALQDVASEVIAMLAPIAYRQKKDLALSGEERPVLVACERTLLSRAVRNLIENAIAHTPPGSTVEVRVGADGALQVADEGPGVPPEKREIIFRRFWRGPVKTRPGAGLGLAIVKRIADTYGGDVSVGNAPGGGAVFTLTLPLAEPVSVGAA